MTAIVTTDRRLTPATDRVALADLRSVLDRPSYTQGRPARLAVAVADLCRDIEGARDRQVNFGADLTVIEERDDWCFVQAALDGYCGWLRRHELSEAGATLPAITHRLSAPASHIYPGPNLKLRETGALSLGARVSVIATEGKFSQLATGGWVPSMHLSQAAAADPGDVAESMMGTPYLWGGNSRWGIDCSGLAQAAWSACGVVCPGDSDMQQKAFAVVEGPYQRGDLLFWPGHVAMALDETRMIHATAYVMGVVIEPIADAIARIDAGGEGPFLGARRPDATNRAVFP
ncbi:C40 family peptidase [Paracoccus sp. (in: a-proteobacteria)]|uniref:C40 family peptidase n=1 Tax=Paracoccus sp. TaxID=267 RepID=UPI0028A05087|nr:C40 family peptidase [Paracoccus sp. (in: a-proteobacteria)]